MSRHHTGSQGSGDPSRRQRRPVAGGIGRITPTTHVAATDFVGGSRYHEFPRLGPRARPSSPGGEIPSSSGGRAPPWLQRKNSGTSDRNAGSNQPCSRNTHMAAAHGCRTAAEWPCFAANVSGPFQPDKHRGAPLPQPADNRGPPADRRDGQASHRRQATKKRRPKCRRAHNTSNSRGSRPRAPLPASNGKMSLRNARGPLRGSSAGS